MEIEFKLSCTPHTATALGRQLTRLTGAAPQKLRLQNTYYDTPNQDLRAQGIALRIRRQGELELQTVKCAGFVSGGLSSRPEWETPYAGRFDFSPIDDARIREALEMLARLPGYRAMLDTHFSRHVWHWRPDTETHVEIVLDRGRILAGGREEAICELELELIAGRPERLFDLVAHLASLAPLFPAPLSKAARGSLLLSGAPQATVIEARYGADCHATFTTLAQTCLDHISINLPANCSRFTAENLHQVRVGLRRLRALLQLFQPLLRKGWPRKALTHGARQHMRKLAPARNLHVLLAEIVLPAAGAVEPRAAQQLQTRLVDLSDSAFAEAEAYLLTREFSEWLLHASLSLHARPLQHKAGKQNWAQHADKLVERQLKTYCKHLRQAKPTPAALHELRKAGKHLHYQLVASALGDSRQRKSVSKQVSRLKGALGQLNDLYSAADTLNHLPPAYTATIAAIGEHHMARHNTLLQLASEQLKPLRRAIRDLQTGYRET